MNLSVRSATITTSDVYVGYARHRHLKGYKE